MITMKEEEPIWIRLRIRLLNMVRIFHPFSGTIRLITSASLKFDHSFFHNKFFPAIQYLKLFYRTLIFHANTFWLHLLYFLSISFISYMALRATSHFGPTYSELDIFFTSVSACTTSSMSVMEMEVFSNYHLFVLTISMFLGGEVFTSMLELRLQMLGLMHSQKNRDKDKEQQISSVNGNPDTEEETLRYRSMKKLFILVIIYLLASQLVGFFLIALYISQSHSSKLVLRRKNLHLVTFSIFTAVSTFTNCGFIPTNENMVVFRRNSGLLLLLTPLALIGNSFYAPTLRFSIWVLEKATKRTEFTYILQHHNKIGFPHLLSGPRSRVLTGTVVTFIALQLLLFCSIEWNSIALNGMSQIEKMVASLFQVINSRHAGESVVDISAISPAVLVIFVLMMYLPQYTSVIPVGENKENNDETSRNRGSDNGMGSFFFSQLTYLIIFVILICITESKKLKHDPLNFSVLFVVVEVISAYGNVGFSSGYSCQRQLTSDLLCRNVYYGLAGKCGATGKVVLIVVMFFGRLKKKFGMQGGMAWNLL